MIHLDLFPGLAGKTYARVNLNTLAAGMRVRADKSPFLNAGLTDRYLRRLHRQMKTDYSFGGYLEDRRDLWRGSYLHPESSVHLGIDINVPAGTAVAVTRPATVVKIATDADRDGGWGSVVMFKLQEPIGGIAYFLYAHLSAASIRVVEGDIVASLQPIAALGRAQENGGWYEHLHVQAITKEAWDRLKGDLKAFDGYAPATEENHPWFPDPEPLLYTA